MNPRLAIIDLDDTLLGEDKRVSSPNREALGRLRAAGYEVVIGSDRHHENIRRYEGEIGSPGWIISSQGAVVQHADTRERLHEFTVPEADALALYEAGRRAGLSLIVYHRDGVFMEAESGWTRLYARRAGWQPRLANLERLAAEGVQKVCLSHAAERVAGAVAELKRACAERLYCVLTAPELLEFLSPRANKGRAAEALARRLGATREDAAAFGDGDNDAELLAWAGFSVAMAHGSAPARQAAGRDSPPGPPESAFARAVDLALA